MTIYSYRSTGYVTKWDSDGNVEASYQVSEQGCTCPAGTRPTCRHRTMLSRLIPIADTHWFLSWDYDRGEVVDLHGTPKSLIDNLAALNLPPTGEETAKETASPTQDLFNLPSYHGITIREVANLPPTVVQTVEAVPAGLHRDDMFHILSLPPGVHAFDLSDPTALHNAIADAVGEPEAKLGQTVEGVAPTTQPWRRM